MRTDQRRSMFLAIAMLAGAFALKWWHRAATADELGFMLEPVSALVGGITGAAPVLEQGQGYLFPALSIRIDRSCSGINFLAIALAAFALIILRCAHAGCARPLIAVLAPAGAYALAIVANAGRIAAMALLKAQGVHLALRAHEALGALFFAGALLLGALALHRLLAKPVPAG